MDKFKEILMCVPEDTESVQGFDELMEVFRVVRSTNAIVKHYLHDDWSLMVELDLINCTNCDGDGIIGGKEKWCASCFGDGLMHGEPLVTAPFEQHVINVSEYIGVDLKQMLIDWSATNDELPIQSIMNSVTDKAYPVFVRHIANYNLNHFDL